jgi:two-component system, OmpR family, sensor histidine kinase KdpD
MKHTETLLSREASLKQPRWERYLQDTLLALVSIYVLTLIIFLLHLPARIPDSLLIYLPVILALASARGSYAALLAALLAFFSFDFFFVAPLYSLIIAKLADFMALIVFLVTAVTTGQLTSTLRKYAEQAHRRERETRILYNLVQETNRAGDIERQLRVFVDSLVDVFSTWNVYDCLLLLPDEKGTFTRQIRTTRPEAQLQLSLAEQELIAQVVSQMRPGASHVHLFGLRVPEQLASEAQSKREQYSLACSVRLLPLKTPQEVLGVLCVLIADDSQLLLIDTDLNIGNGQPSAQAVFLRVFLEQAVALIERGRLQHESLRIKVLQETDTLRAALLSSVSHDLRTPLSAIMTAATSLQHVDAQWDDEERQSQAQLIEHEAKRLNRLVENLLDMSRIEGGALRPNKMLYPLDELIRDVLGRLYLLLQSRPLQLSLPADLPPVELDYMQIDQVVTNLLENVARYTPAGSAIDIELLSQREWIEVRIADRGPGIALNEREQIFDKFYRVLGGKSRGSGLGLTVCQGLIEAHGGHIWVEPRDEGGAVFCFTLPQSTMEIKEQ